MNIAFCCDKTALPGLHVSLYTLLKSNPRRDSLTVHVLHEGLGQADRAGLTETLKLAGGGNVTFKPFSTSNLRHLKGFHGNYMPYARLFLADHFPELDRLLYLDSDLFVNCSISPLENVELGLSVIGAVTNGTIEYALENAFFRELGLAATDPYFNSGVLLIDVERWRNAKVGEQAMRFLEKYKERCQSADQTVLNALFSKQHCSLDRNFNRALYPHERVPADRLPNAICHFVGAPKPWDFCGHWLHGSGEVFYDNLRKTAFYTSGGKIPASLIRTLRLARSYYQLIRKRS